MRAFEEEVNELETFFKNVTGFEPWSLQRAWIRRLVAGESFAMVAPTGVGKSTLLAVYVLYRAINYKWKIYVVAPTKEIAAQLWRRIEEYYDRAKKFSDSEIRVLLYVSGVRNAKKVKERIASGDFDILITSAGFLSKNYELLRKWRFNLVVADDLDALLRNSRNIDRILQLLGFDDEEIKLAYEIAKAKQELVVARLAGREHKAQELEVFIEEAKAKLKILLLERHCQLVVASATGRSRGLKSKVLRELLGFEGGAVFEYWRRIIDTYVYMDEPWLEQVVEIVKRLKSGLVFVAQGMSPKVVAEYLKRHGIRVEVVKSGRKSLDRFRNGEVDVLIGSASYYGILVRGIDEPLRVKFTIFIGVPRSGVKLENALNSVRFMYVLLEELSRRGVECKEYLEFIVNILKRASIGYINVLNKLLAKGCVECDDKTAEILDKLLEIKKWLYNTVKVMLGIEGKIVLPTAVVMKRGRDVYVYRPDPYTYIQASGRASRLLNGRKTLGLSLIVADDYDLLSMLERRLKSFVPELKFVHITAIDLEKVVEQVQRSRILVAGSSKQYDRIVTALMIVESPTKARTIASMFGKSAKRYVGEVPVYEAVIPLHNDEVVIINIAASLGHLTDLVTDEGFHGVDVSGGRYMPIYDFIIRCRSCGRQTVGLYERCPYCNSSNIVSSKHVVNALRKLAHEVDRIYIATDPDNEGEKIAFDLYMLLKPYNSNVVRVEFHEITRRAILEALRNPRKLDIGRIRAQIVRRVDDRWVGFEISTWLQLKLGKKWLGAGRVQSPVLLWVVDRYEEYLRKRGFWVVLDAEGMKLRLFIFERDEAEKIAEKARREGIYVLEAKEYVKEVQPPPPFSTDDMIIEAGRKLRYTAVLTMKLAQQLFESGFITYHRTDCNRVSNIGIEIARQYLERLGMNNLFVPRTWSQGHVGAHEAIRPTAPVDAEELKRKLLRGELGLLTNISELHVRLYDLIFRRFVASQMAASLVKFVHARFGVGNYETVVDEATEIVKEGFTVVYPPRLVPALRMVLNRDRLKVNEVIIKRGAAIRLLTSAEVVRLMKTKGIGRPSTYSKAIENNVRHGYIVLSKKRKALIPTKLGIEISTVIRNNFLELVGEEATRKLEKLVDMVERGELNLAEALDNIKHMVAQHIKFAELGAVAQENVVKVNQEE